MTLVQRIVNNGSNGNGDGEWYKEQLKSLITNANKLHDLLPMTHFVPLTAVKSLFVDKVDELADEKARDAYYRSLPITQIFPDDVTQYILSFAGLYNVKAVSKNWKMLADKNEEIFMKKLYGSVQAETDKVKYDENINKTWIIHQSRNKLNKTEIGLGFKGIFHHKLYCNKYHINNNKYQ